MDITGHNHYIPDDHDLERAFWKYHREHPDVYEILRRLAYQVLNRGKDTYSIRALMHIVRWEVTIGENYEEDEIGVKLSNNHSPYYARLLMQEHPPLRGFFRIQSLAVGEPSWFTAYDECVK